MTDTTITENISALMASLDVLTYKDQLTFWERFRRVHRKRTADGEAVLEPELLRAVDDRIAKLRPLAATED